MNPHAVASSEPRGRLRPSGRGVAPRAILLCASLILFQVEHSVAGVQFFVRPDGRLMNASPDLDLEFQQALSLRFAEFAFDEFTHDYIFDTQPPRLTTGSVGVRPLLLNAAGNPAADLGANGGRLIETYPSVPNIPGIIGGGGAALLNRTFAGGTSDVRGAAIEFTFTAPVEGFGTWILDDILAPSRFVLKVTEAGGQTFTSPPLESGNGTNLAVEGFLAVVSDVGLIRVVVEQQTVPGGVATANDFFYLDHIQVGGRLPPEICDDGIDNNGDDLVDCADPDCQNRPDYPCGETLCADGKDNDGDGLADCADTDCFGRQGCTVEALCSDGLDNDGDGLIDCADPDCSENPVCPEICDDGIDNDADGRIDCADLECMALEVCPGICESIDPDSIPLGCVERGCSGLPACGDRPQFFISPDGRLLSPPADPGGDLGFQAALTRGFTELRFDGLGQGYLTEPLVLESGLQSVRPLVLGAGGVPAVDPSTNDGRLIETYAAVPSIEGIIGGHPGGAALINRTARSDGQPVTGAAVEFTFSSPVEGFGVWILDDVPAPNRYVLKVTDLNGSTHTSGPLDSMNGGSLAVEGFIGAVSRVGLTRAIIQQQTLSGDISDADLFYLDHLQVGGAPGCSDPFADMDGDGDVDQEDFGRFQLCVTGPVLRVTPACACADRNGDRHVDGLDFAIFHKCVTGARYTADPACDD